MLSLVSSSTIIVIFIILYVSLYFLRWCHLQQLLLPRRTITIVYILIFLAFPARLTITMECKTLGVTSWTCQPFGGRLLIRDPSPGHFRTRYPSREPSPGHTRTCHSSRGHLQSLGLSPSHPQSHSQTCQPSQSHLQYRDLSPSHPWCHSWTRPAPTPSALLDTPTIVVSEQVWHLQISRIQPALVVSKRAWHLQFSRIQPTLVVSEWVWHLEVSWIQPTLVVPKRAWFHRTSRINPTLVVFERVGLHQTRTYGRLQLSRSTSS